MINDLVEEGTEDLEFAKFLDLMTARIFNKDSRKRHEKSIHAF